MLFIVEGSSEGFLGNFKYFLEFWGRLEVYLDLPFIVDDQIAFVSFFKVGIKELILKKGDDFVHD